MGFTDDPYYEVEEYDTLPYIIKKPEQTPTPVSEKEHSLLWSKSKSSEEEGSFQSYSVSMNELGNVVAMSDIYQDSNGTHSGSVEIYQYDGSHWNKKGSTIHGESAYDYSGASIKLCRTGNTIIIGAPWNDDGGKNAGHVRVYHYVDGDWKQKGADIDGNADELEHGCSVDIASSGNIIAVGSSERKTNAGDPGHQHQ